MQALELAAPGKERKELFKKNIQRLKWPYHHLIGGLHVQENELYDLIIVGGGPGGLSAGIYALRAALTTILIENCCVDGRCGSAFCV